jgi:hypothetical protein
MATIRRKITKIIREARGDARDIADGLLDLLIDADEGDLEDAADVIGELLAEAEAGVEEEA